MVYVRDGDGSQVCASSLLSVLPASHAVIVVIQYSVCWAWQCDSMKSI